MSYINNENKKEKVTTNLDLKIISSNTLQEETKPNVGTLSGKIVRQDGTAPHYLPIELYLKTSSCCGLRVRETFVASSSLGPDGKFQFTYPLSSMKNKKFEDLVIKVKSATNGLYEGTEQIVYDSIYIDEFAIKTSQKNLNHLKIREVLKANIFEYSKGRNNPFQPKDCSHIPKFNNQHSPQKSALTFFDNELTYKSESTFSKSYNIVSKKMEGLKKVSLDPQNLVRQIMESYDPKALKIGEKVDYFDPSLNKIVKKNLLYLDLDIGSFMDKEIKDCLLPNHIRIRFVQVIKEKIVVDLDLLEIGITKINEEKFTFCRNPFYINYDKLRDEEKENNDSINIKIAKTEDMEVEENNEIKTLIKQEEDIEIQKNKDIQNFNKYVIETSKWICLLAQARTHFATHIMYGQYAMAAFRNFFESPIVKLIKIANKGPFSINEKEEKIMFSKSFPGVFASSPFTEDGIRELIHHGVGSLNYSWKPTGKRYEADILGALKELLYKCIHEGVSNFVKNNLTKILTFKHEIRGFSNDLVNNSLLFQYDNGISNDDLINEKLDILTEVNLRREHDKFAMGSILEFNHYEFFKEEILNDSKDKTIEIKSDTLNDNEIERLVNALTHYLYLGFYHGIIHNQIELWSQILYEISINEEQLNFSRNLKQNKNSKNEITTHKNILKQLKIFNILLDMKKYKNGNTYLTNDEVVDELIDAFDKYEKEFLEINELAVKYNSTINFNLKEAMIAIIH